jgi:hypothetical protein
VRGETVWKIGMGAESGVRQPPGEAKRFRSGAFLHQRPTVDLLSGDFPNSFGREIMRTSPLRGSQRIAIYVPNITHLGDTLHPDREHDTGATIRHTRRGGESSPFLNEKEKGRC